MNLGNNINFIFIATRSQTRRNVRVAANMFKRHLNLPGNTQRLAVITICNKQDCAKDKGVGKQGLLLAQRDRGDSRL